MQLLKTSLAALALSTAGLALAAPAFADGEVNIYSYRQPDLIKPLLDEFTKETGITTNVLFLDKGLVERIQAEGANSPADVILTVDIARLTEAKEGGVTQQEESAWLLDFWGKKDVAGLLLMPPTRHVMLHLNDCCRWKQEIRTKKKFFRS